MNLQTPIRDRARGLRGPGLTSEQEAQVEEAIAVGEAIPNIRPTSGEQLPFTSALNGADGGAVAIVEGGRVVGFTLPAGQTGAGSFTLPRTFFTKEEAQRLKGCTIRFPVVMEASVGFLAATPFGGNAVRVDRDTGFVDDNEGSALAAQQAEGSTVLTRDYLYEMQGDEVLVGPTLQIAPNAPTGAVRSFKVTSCVYEVVATPASTATTGADAVLDNRFAATAPKVDVFRSIEPALKMNGGAQVLLDESGRDMGATVAIGATGAGTILQWKLPLTGALREAMQGGQPELELVFETNPGWDRAHSMNMQAGKFDLTWDDFLTANRRDYQTIDLATGQRTRRVMGFSFLAPNDLSEFSDLRAYIVLNDATPATVAESIRLTGYSIKMFRTRGNGELPVPRTLMLAGEVSRASAVEQALATVYGTGKRVGAQLPVSDYGSIAQALKAATALAGPGAIAMVELDEGTYFEHSLGKITDGTDGVLPGQDGAFIGLRGKGMGRTRIDGSLPADTPIDKIQETSTIDFNANQYLEGVTLIAEGERYGGHVDNVNYKKNTCLIWRQVEVEHRGNDAADAYHGTTVWPSQHPIAIGTTSGSFYGFYECRLKGRRAAFSAHDQRAFEQPSTVEWVGGPLTAVDTTGWSYRLESIGSMVMNRALLAHAPLGGEVSMAAQPWLPDEPENQPADHRCWELTGYGNSPAAFRIQDFGRALRITSATTGPASKVAVSNAATPILFGKSGTDGVTQVDGDVGLSGYAYGWADISDASTKADITALKVKLGNRTASPITLTVHVDALAPIDIVFDKNYPTMTNAEIIADMNAALGGVAIVSEYAVGERYRPFFSDEEQQLKNSSGTTILMGMALAVDGDGAGTVRPMTATDLPSAFAGVAWEDIRPGAHGRVKTSSWLALTDLLRSDGAGPELNSFFRIDPAKPGYVRSNAASGILRVVRGSLGAGLWTVEVAPREAIADYQAAVLPSTPGSAGTDIDGFADWYVDADGMTVSGRRLQVGDLVVTNEHPNKMILLDPDGFVLFDSDDVSDVTAQPGDASAYAARDAANVAYAMAGQNDLMPIVQQVERGKVNIILTYGQSLRRSSRGYPPLTTAQPSYADAYVYSLGQANRPSDDDDPTYAPVTSGALYPLLAVSHNNAGTILDHAALRALGPDTAVPGESISISATYWLRQQYLARHNLADDPETPFLVLDCAVGGKSVSELSKPSNPGDVPTSFYNRILSGLMQIRDHPDFSGKEFVVTLIDFGQGEEDYSDGAGGVDPDVASYQAAVVALMNDIYADILDIFENGQKRPAIFLAQAGGAFTTDATNLHVGQAQLNLVTQIDGYFPTGPNYPVVNVASAHPDNNGYRWLGQYCGRAWASVLVHGRRPNIVYPRRATWDALSNEVIIDFVSTGGAISEGHPYDGFTAQTVANLGISAKFGSTILPLGNVRLVGAMTVAATLLVTPAGAPLIQIGTKALDNGYIGIRCASRMVAPESYTFISDAGQDPAANVPALVGKPYNLDDWCWAASLQSEEI